MVCHVHQYNKDRTNGLCFCAGEVEQEAEIDLSKFLARQKLEDEENSLLKAAGPTEINEEIDPSVSNLTSKFTSKSAAHKGKVQYVEWTQEQEEMFHDAAVADANRGMCKPMQPLINVKDICL